MPDTSLQHTREELARREVGRTNIGRWTAWVLVAQFVLVVGGVLVSEILNPESQRQPREPSVTSCWGNPIAVERQRSPSPVDAIANGFAQPHHH